LELLRSAWHPKGVLAHLQDFQPPTLSAIHRSAWNRNSPKFGVLREEREAEASPFSLVETRLV
jgi:hypothetical protein